MQFRDLHAQYEALESEINAGIQSVIQSSAFILGKPVTELECQLAEYVGRRHCIGVASGTDALVLSLKVHNVKAGDAVFVPDFTYIASASCASLVGATPVFVDIDFNTFNMCPQALEEAIERTLKEGKLTPRAIIPVDLFGLPADFDKINKVAEKYGLFVLEDAAQGFGGRIGNKKACSFGCISATSFFPAKPLGGYGDGGAIFTDDDAIAERLRSLRAGGKSATDKYDNREIGYNSRLDSLQAAILLPKLKAFSEYELEAVNKAAGKYSAALKEKVRTPVIPESFYSSWAQYTILLNSKAERDTLQAALKAKSIPSMIYYPRGMHQQACFADRKLGNEFYPNTVQASQRVLSLPMHPYFKEEDQALVIETVLNTL